MRYFELPDKPRLLLCVKCGAVICDEPGRHSKQNHDAMHEQIDAAGSMAQGYDLEGNRVGWNR